MKNIILALAVLIAGCNRDLSPLNTVATSYAATPTMTTGCPPPFNPQMYCDFESDPSSGFWWPGGPSAMWNTWSGDTANSCYRSWKITSSPAVPYGHWNGLSLNKSITGASTYNMWYKSNATYTTSWSWDEGTSSGADGEEWTTSITFIGDNSWHLFALPLSSFVSGGGNNIPDTQDIIQVWFYDTSPVPAYIIYIDDIEFLP